MSFLLDTQVFLWLESGSPKLPKRIVDLITRTDDDVFVSAASLWEIAIKRRSGRLVFTGSIADAIARDGFRELSISGRDADLAGSLDWNHSDPFDRLLVAQCMNGGLQLVTADATISERREITILRVA